MCGSGKFLREKTKGRHPQWTANSQGGREVGPPLGQSRAHAVGGRQTDWGPGLDDKGTLLRELRAHQRNEEPTGGGAGGEGAGARPRVDTKQEPAERAW